MPANRPLDADGLVLGRGRDMEPHSGGRTGGLDDLNRTNWDGEPKSRSNVAHDEDSINGNSN
jgi:hypothetical protein